jgi:5-bromo-4-chloroindolyl phosphate hydrolysis protein
MTYENIDEVKTRITALEGLLQALRDESSIEAKKSINDALRLLQDVYDTTHGMDKAVNQKGC